MTASRDPDRLIHAFLHEGLDELPDPVYDVVRDRIEQTRQRAAFGPWRTSDMNRYLKIGLAAAAVVVIAVVGFQYLGDSNTGAPDATETPQPTATLEPTPSPSTWAGLAAGPFVVNDTDDPVQITVNIASAGWSAAPAFDAVNKDDDGLDAPETVGAALLAWAFPAGTGFNVYGDPCQLSTTIPETPATTPDEIAAAFAAQASSDPTAPVDVTVGGFAGKAITLHVPMSFDLPGATREEKFADCEEGDFVFYGIEGETGTSEDTQSGRGAQGAGQIDELWILDVNGAIVILDAAYSPATPPDLVDEVQALAESATFEAP